MEIKSFTEYYYRQIKIAFIIMVGLAIVVNLLDLTNQPGPNPRVFYLNLVTISILVFSLFLHFYGKVSLHFCISLAMYVVIGNFLLSYFFSYRIEVEILNYLLRETFFLILMLIFAGLFVHRTHALVILAFILMRYIIQAVHLRSSFLMDNIYILLMTFVALTAVVYFLSGKLHQSITDIQLKQAEITEKNEELSESNSTLQKMNTSKDKFFSIISHDLKNPLNALSGFVDLMIVKGDHITEEKKASYLKNMRTTIDNIQELLSDLLEWSRTQSNQISSNPNQFRLKDLSETVCYYLKQVAELKEITLEDQVSEGLMGYADFNMMFTIIRNLVSNAIKFSKKDQKVILLSEDLGDELKVMVIDEGVGMEPEEVKKLFKINETFSTPGTNNEKGTGLGLILCKEFVEKNNGKIGVESIPGKGSTFWFTLPKVQAKIS